MEPAAPWPEESALIDRIRRILAQLPRAERRFAELVLDKPNVTVTWTVTDAANFAGVSEPSVIRFCRRVGCAGFPGFKLELVRALAKSRTEDRSEFDPRDPLAGIVGNVFERAARCLADARRDLDLDAVTRAIDRIATARRLEIYGFGISGFIASDVQHRMSSIGVNAVAYSDPYLQSVAAPLLTPADAMLALSLSGRTGFLVESAAMVKSTGARVIALAPAGSPVAEVADIRIHVNLHREDRPFVPLTARLAFHAILDAIVAGVALRRSSRRRARRDGRPRPPGRTAAR